MAHRKLSLWATVFVLAIGIMSASLCGGQQTSSSVPTASQPPRNEETKAHPKPSDAAPTPAPAIDPDVKQWFLEKMKERRPLDPKDIDVLTGRSREAQAQSEYQNFGQGFWPSYYGYGPWVDGRWNSPFGSHFVSPGFFLFGNRRGLGNHVFFFNPPFFRPFGFFGHNTGPWHGRH